MSLKTQVFEVRWVDDVKIIFYNNDNKKQHQHLELEIGREQWKTKRWS